MKIRHMLTALLFVAMAAIPCKAETQVYFSPYDNCEKIICRAIDKASSTILVSMYNFTSDNIAGALARAKKRGVDVAVVLDLSTWKGRNAKGHWLRDNNVPVVYDCEHQLMHSKYIILDEKTVITGSYNYTFSANNRNAENIAVINETRIAHEYMIDWKRHFKHAKVHITEKDQDTHNRRKW